MAITAGQTAEASDFINESEKNATPSNDNGRVPKLENVAGEDAKISPKFIPNSEIPVTLGETIDGTTTPKAVFIQGAENPSTLILESTANTSTNQFLLDGTLDQASQVFTNTDFDFITEIKWSSSDVSIIASDSLFIEIYAVDGSGNPTGLALASQEFISTNFADIDDSICIFDTPAPVSRNTDYAVVQRADSASSNYYYAYYQTTNDASLSPAKTSIDGGANWTTQTGKYARFFTVKGIQDLTTGKTYLSDSTVVQRNIFNGFVGVAGVLDDVVGMRNDVSGEFTGLTIGSKYFVDIDGTISLTGEGANTGTALSATEIRINTEKEVGDVESISGTSGVTTTAPSSGFWFGRYYDNTSSSTSVSVIMVMNGITISVSVSENTTFCFPCNRGDTITFSHSYTVIAYFRPLY